MRPTIPTDADNNLTVPSKSEAEVDNWGFGELSNHKDATLGYWQGVDNQKVLEGMQSTLNDVFVSHSDRGKPISQLLVMAIAFLGPFLGGSMELKTGLLDKPKTEYRALPYLENLSAIMKIAAKEFDESKDYISLWKYFCSCSTTL